MSSYWPPPGCTRPPPGCNNNNNICLFQTHKIGTAYICRSIHIVIQNSLNGVEVARVKLLRLSASCRMFTNTSFSAFPSGIFTVDSPSTSQAITSSLATTSCISSSTISKYLLFWQLDLQHLSAHILIIPTFHVIIPSHPPVLLSAGPLMFSK